MRPLLLAAALAVTGSVFAQTRLTGRLVAPDGTPLEGAAILRLSPTDSTLQEGAVTDAEGRYALRPDSTGNTILRAQALGYRTQAWRVTGTEGGTHTLHPLSGELKEVVVTATRPLIELQPDRLVVNVAGSINAQGSNALELLRKAPGVTVDQSDNVQLKGRSGVRIWIDGKPSPLGGQDLAAYLRTLQASDIDRIELISNPPARYEAQGTGGIIDIRLKKNRSLGTNGSVSATVAQGILPKFNQGLTLNHRNRRVNVFGNLSGYQSANRNLTTLRRQQSDSLYLLYAPRTTTQRGVNYKAGADWFLDSRHTLGLLVNGNQTLHLDRQTTRTDISADTPGAPTVRRLQADANTFSHRANLNANLNYRYADTAGRTLTADLDYGHFHNPAVQTVPNVYTHPEQGDTTTVYTFRARMPIWVDLYSAKLDYEQKLLGGNLGLGGRLARVQTRNRYAYEDVQGYAPLIFRPGRSNRFSYAEQVSAAYAQYRRGLAPGLSLQAGLRLEHTHTLGILDYCDGKPSTRFTRDYLNLFPSGGLSWDAGKHNGFNLTYSRRINRPAYSSLNPFEFRLDELTYQRGNPYLKPELADVTELNHAYKGRLFTSLGYTRVLRFTTETVYPADERRVFSQQDNLAVMRQVYAGLTYSGPVLPGWQGTVSVQGQAVSFTPYPGVVTGLPVRQSYNANAYMQQVVTLGRGWKAELSGWFQSGGVRNATFRDMPMGGLDAGLQRSLWADRANLRLAVTDLLHTVRWRGRSTYNGIGFDAANRWESRQIRLSFDYRFGSDQVRPTRNRSTGAEDLGNRIR